MIEINPSLEINNTLPTPLEQDKSQISEASQRILAALKSSKLITRNRSGLRKDFVQITPEELKDVLGVYFQETITEIDPEDMTKALEKLARIIPMEKLDKAVAQGSKTALETAKSMLHEAKYHLNNSQDKSTYSLRTKLSDIIDSLILLLDRVFSSFGIADLFKPTNNIIDRDRVAHKIMMLVHFFSMLSAMLLPLLGLTLAGPIIGGTLLLLNILSLIFPYIRPLPSTMPFTENWSKKYRQGKMGDLSLVKGRKEILDSLANTLVKNEKGELKKHPLLIGESGVGKTQAVEAFVQAIERGEYPELKGKKVFCVNTPVLFDKTDFLSTGDPLQQIQEAMGRHRNKIILVFDEIHVAYQEGKNALLGEKLKKMLDPHGEFPHVIGITTKKEFETTFLPKESEKDAAHKIASLRRFNPITIENTDANVTQEILSHSLLKNGKSALREKNALQLIYEKTHIKNLPQPQGALENLNECLIRTSATQTSPLAKKIEGLKNRKKFLASQGAAFSFNFEEEKDTSSEINQLKEQIRELKKELTSEKKQLKHLFRAKESIAKSKMETYKTVMKIGKIRSSKLSSKDKINVNTFLLMSRFLVPATETYVREKAKTFGIKVVIDETLIDEVVQQQRAATS